MKRLMEIQNLLIIALAASVLFSVTPVQPIFAGEYEMDEEEYGGADDDLDNSDEGYSEYGWASYSVGSLNAHCAAYASAETWIWWAAGGFSASASLNSWAYAYKYWEWTGGGTPTGGTLDYSFYVSGDTYASGDSSAWGSGSGGAASSGGSSGSSEESVSGSSSGGVLSGSTGSASALVSPSECGDATVDTGNGYYYATTEWSLDVEDEDEISAGTSYVSFSVSADCSADATSNASSGGSSGYAASYAGGDASAGASGSASFP